jgi:hypothetical protein
MKQHQVGHEQEDIESNATHSVQTARKNPGDAIEADDDDRTDNLELEREGKISQRAIRTRVRSQARAPMTCALDDQRSGHSIYGYQQDGDEGTDGSREVRARGVYADASENQEAH